jgi:voltage-gated potassium channel
MSIRNALYKQFTSTDRPEGRMSFLNGLVIALIVVGIVAVVIETEPTIYDPNKTFFAQLDLSLGCIFSLEYVARLWAIGEDPKYAGITGRLRYIFSPIAIVDFLAIAPLFISVVSNDFFLLRLARLMRILAMGRFGRYSRALQEFVQVIRTRWYELFISILLVVVTVLVSSSIMYMVEGSEQPENFGSIPRALWWGVVTLSTVGYGDVYPKTVLGKICCSLIIIAGIGLIAVPTGILAAAFSEVFMQRRNNNDRSN